MDQKQPANLKRRSFLLAAGVGGAGAVAAVATGGAARTEAVAATPPAEKSGGYAETRHVSNYYRTARV